MEEDSYIFEERITDDMDIYSDLVLDEMVDEDKISVEEAAFMQGYNDAG